MPEEGSEARTPCPFPVEQAALVAEIRQHLEQLNTHLATVTVGGCAPLVLRRLFIGDARLHGRFYATGPESYINVLVRDRHTLRLAGQPVVEIDLRATALSILLAHAGQAIPSDPYTLGPLAAYDREAVKAWFMQTLNSNAPPIRWSPKHSEGVRRVPIKDITAAATATYPEIARALDLLPADLQQRVPLGRRGWALGQWLMGIEAKVMEDAVTHLMDTDFVALPLHDAMLCWEADAEAARKPLSRGC